MKDIYIRKWEEKDLETIKKLSRSLCIYDRDHFDSSLNCDWLDTWYWKKYLSYLTSNENSCIFIAEYDWLIVGYLFWELSDKLPWRNIKSQSELVEIFVVWEYRWMQIGNKLLDTFKKWSLQKWVENIKLLVSNWNDKSINFYKNNWFTDYDITLECKLQ
jgi:GNAT superfamily N-acetyltransferase